MMCGEYVDANLARTDSIAHSTGGRSQWFSLEQLVKPIMHLDDLVCEER